MMVVTILVLSFNILLSSPREKAIDNPPVMLRGQEALRDPVYISSPASLSGSGRLLVNDDHSPGNYNLSLMFAEPPPQQKQWNNAEGAFDLMDDGEFRTGEEMAHSRECLHKGQGYLYFLHMRKAGGSSIRNYLDEFWELQPDRTVYVTEGDMFNVSCFHHQGEMVMFTAMRHPIDRILSSYWFEGVTGKTAVDFRLMRPQDFKPLAEKVSFEAWVASVREKALKDPLKDKRVWTSVDNYYITTLTGRYRQPLAPVTEEDYELAKDILSSFDAVMITEWMGWANQTALINAIVGEPTLRFPARNKNKVSKPSNLLDEATLEWVRDMNKWDIKLYEYAKDLMRSKLKAFASLGYSSRGVGRGSSSNSGSSTLDCRAPVLDPLWDPGFKPITIAPETLRSSSERRRKELLRKKPRAPACMKLWWKRRNTDIEEFRVSAREHP